MTPSGDGQVKGDNVKGVLLFTQLSRAHVKHLFGNFWPASFFHTFHRVYEDEHLLCVTFHYLPLMNTLSTHFSLGLNISLRVSGEGNVM